jgi:hypothetical protein
MTDALTNPLAVVECGGNPRGFRGTPLWDRSWKFRETLKCGRGSQLESGDSPIPRQPPHSTTLSRLTEHFAGSWFQSAANWPWWRPMNPGDPLHEPAFNREAARNAESDLSSHPSPSIPLPVEGRGKSGSLSSIFACVLSVCASLRRDRTEAAGEGRECGGRDTAFPQSAFNSAVSLQAFAAGPLNDRVPL